MWKASGQNISMAEGDYGITLPITLGGVTLGSGDAVSFTIKASVDGDAILTKTFSSISGNTLNLVLTSAESALLTVGLYVYAMDWYHDGEFMCNLVPAGRFRVVDKA